MCVRRVCVCVCVCADAYGTVTCVFVSTDMTVRMHALARHGQKKTALVPRSARVVPDLFISLLLHVACFP